MRHLAALVAALSLAPPASALTLSAMPARVSFGDAVVVTATAQGPIDLQLGSWTALSAPETVIRDGVTTVSQRVVCLAEACVPNAAERFVQLPTASAGGTRTSARILVAARVAPEAVAAAKALYRRDASVAPSRSHGALVAVFSLAAVALVVLAALAVVPGRRREEASKRASQDALERALRLLRESAGRPAPDRRRAADLVGRLAPGIAGAARDLAWARRDPRIEDVEQLAGRVEGGG